MISRISIRNFKSLREVIIPTRALNVFTGLNSSGKSTLLQSLVLIRQSWEENNVDKQRGLFLGNDKSWISLGTFQDIFNQDARSKDFFEIKIKSSADTHFSFKSAPYDQDNKSLITIPGRFSQSTEWSDYIVFGKNFQYLGAERIGPTESYPRFPNEKVQFGRDGRYAPHYFDLHRRDAVGPHIFIDPYGSNRETDLQSALAFWIERLSPGILVDAKENLQTNQVDLYYKYRYTVNEGPGVPSQDRKPQNIGFGLTHTFPILIALLTAKPGDLILIENPETHLHPRGQSQLGQLISAVAQFGVQLFVETHSDHIINGMRLAAKQTLIDKDNLVFFLASLQSHSGNSDFQDLYSDENGRLNKWPKNFFDEWGNVLDQLL